MGARPLGVPHVAAATEQIISDGDMTANAAIHSLGH